MDAAFGISSLGGGGGLQENIGKTTCALLFGHVLVFRRFRMFRAYVGLWPEGPKYAT